MFTLARPAPSPPLTALASVSPAAATPRTVITLVTISTAIPVGAPIRPMAISITAPIPSMTMVIPVPVPVGITVPASAPFPHFKLGTQHVVVVVQHGAVVGGWAEINTNTTHKHGVGLETFHAGQCRFYHLNEHSCN